MPFFTWSAEYSVGVRDIDDQHRRLIGLINEVHEAVSGEPVQEVIDRILNELVAYTHDHFDTEETLMRSVGYPELEEHIQAHHRLVEQLEGLIVANVPSSDAASQRLPGFLRDWLTNHVMDDDRKYGRYLARQKSGAGALFDR